jgi:hypothetical protein
MTMTVQCRRQWQFNVVTSMTVLISVAGWHGPELYLVDSAGPGSMVHRQSDDGETFYARL